MKEQDKEIDKDSNNFLSKFSNRIETMGKEGIKGLIKHTNIQINIRNDKQNGYVATNPNVIFQRPSLINNSNSNYPLQNKIYSINTIQYLPSINSNVNLVYTDTTNNDQLDNIGFNTGQNIQRTPTLSLIHRPPVLNSLNYSEWKRYPNVIPIIASQETNKKEIQPFVNNHNIFQERLYQPYSLQDYKQLQLDAKLGSLGPNLGTKDWIKRAARRNKMGLYGSAVIKEKVGLHEFTSGETPNEARAREKQLMIEKSIRYTTRNYGKNIKLSNYNYSNYNSKNIKDIPQLLPEFDENYHEVLNLNKKKYMERLDKLKESLMFNY